MTRREAFLSVRLTTAEQAAWKALAAEERAAVDSVPEGQPAWSRCAGGRSPRSGSRIRT